MAHHPLALLFPSRIYLWSSLQLAALYNCVSLNPPSHRRHSPPHSHSCMHPSCLVQIPEHSLSCLRHSLSARARHGVRIRLRHKVWELLPHLHFVTLADILQLLLLLPSYPVVTPLTSPVPASCLPSVCSGSSITIHKPRCAYEKRLHIIFLRAGAFAPSSPPPPEEAPPPGRGDESSTDDSRDQEIDLAPAPDTGKAKETPTFLLASWFRQPSEQHLLPDHVPNIH